MQCVYALKVRSHARPALLRICLWPRSKHLLTAVQQRLMSDVHKLLQDYASAPAIVSTCLAPVLIGLGQELLTAHAGHVQGVSSKMAPWTAAAVGVSLGLLKSTAGALQACAAATNIRAMQLRAACEAHIEVVQAELDKHEQAAEEHQKFANSIDWDTVKAAVPTSISTGAAAGSLLAYLESQAAYVAACNTWTGWLFGVAAPAGFAATVLPFALPAAFGVGYTGYKYWKGKKDRQYSEERAKEEMKALGEN